MAVFGRAFRGLRIASLEPGPDALIIAVGQTLRQIVRLLVEAGEKSTDRLLGTFTHRTNDGLRQVNKQAWPRLTVRMEWKTQTPKVELTAETINRIGGLTCMATLLDKTLKREVRVGDRAYIVAISPLTLKLTPKGKRKGLELNWESLVSGDAALAAALNASVGRFTAGPPGVKAGKQSGGPSSG
jgi:hypothetical protein